MELSDSRVPAIDVQKSNPRTREMRGFQYILL